MLIRLLLVFFCFFSFSVDPAFARSNKNVRSVAKVKKVSNKNTKKVRLRFEPQWYYSLKPRARKAYLQALSKIVLRAARGNAGLDRNLWDLLIQEVDAIDNARLSRGWIYDRSIGFANALANIDFSYLDGGTSRSLNQCTAGTFPCAIYTCLRRDASGNPLLCCEAADSTPNCVSQGNQAANRAVLEESLERCRNTVSPYCSTVQRLLQNSTAGLEDWCNDTNRRNQQYCTDALASFEATGGERAPAAADPPSGANCERVSDELARRHDLREGGRDEDEVGASNNAFWREMTYVARRVCNMSVRQANERLGVCNEPDLRAPGVGVPGRETVRTTNPSRCARSDSECNANREAYDQCIEARLEERMGERHRREFRELTELFGSREIDEREFDRRLRAQRNEHEEERSTYEAQLRGNANCSYRRDISTPINGSPNSIHDIPDATAILEKMQAGTALTNTERNNFMSVTGITPENFRESFCADSFDAFQSSINGNSSASQIRTMRINEDVDAQVALRNAANAANQSLRTCMSRLQSAEESGCSYNEIENVAGITRASNTNPLMVRNRETGQCLLVVQHESDRVFDRRDTETGTDITRMRQIITLEDTRGGSEEREMNPTEFGQRYQLFGYSCTNSVPPPGSPQENPAVDVVF